MYSLISFSADFKSSKDPLENSTKLDISTLIKSCILYITRNQVNSVPVQF